MKAMQLKARWVKAILGETPWNTKTVYSRSIMLYIVHQIAFALSLFKLLAPNKTIFGDFDILAPP